MGPIADLLRTKLERGLSPDHLEISDQSDRHAGHAGARAGGESHFDVRIVSAAFAGLRPVQRQRLVHALLEAELAGPVHALSLQLRAPGET
ncbi:MAG TPA: BolA family protein [Caulobacteraceae bacterium]|jgi:BolA protein|nr:BolA family protein [Caulobacteraceae bacterium]